MLLDVVSILETIELSGYLWICGVPQDVRFRQIHTDSRLWCLFFGRKCVLYLHVTRGEGLGHQRHGEAAKVQLTWYTSTIIHQRLVHWWFLFDFPWYSGLPGITGITGWRISIHAGLRGWSQRGLSWNKHILAKGLAVICSKFKLYVSIELQWKLNIGLTDDWICNRIDNGDSMLGNPITQENKAQKTRIPGLSCSLC